MKSLCVFFLLGFSLFIQAQQQSNVRATVMIIRSLRYMQQTQDADDIMKEVFRLKSVNNYTRPPFVQYDEYTKTSVDFVADKNTIEESLASEKEKANHFYLKYITPFESWLDYAREVPNTNDLGLTSLLYEDYRTITEDHLNHHTGTVVQASRTIGFFEAIGQQNISSFLDEAFGDIDLYKDNVSLMLLDFKSPLSNDAFDVYQYNLMGFKSIAGNDCFEIAFYAKENKMKENAFAGYLYIDASGSYALRKAVFTINEPSNMNFLKDVLITHSYSPQNGVMCPQQKENVIVLGNEIQGSFVISRNTIFSKYTFDEPDVKSWKTTYNADYEQKDKAYWQSVRPIPLTPSQDQITELAKVAPDNWVYNRLQNLLVILLSNHVTLGGINGKVEFGPILQFLSYNDMEGLRLKIGGNTTVNLMNQLLVGGYVAYGVKDELWKYRGDLIYSFFPRNKYIWEYRKRLLSFSYVSDLNIPGQDLLTSTRDNVLYSFSHTSTNNMSLQKIGVLSFENENKYHFSYKVGAKVMSDNPLGIVKYMKVSGQDTSVVDRLNTSEITLSARYSPKERFFQNRDKRIPIRRGDVELVLNHRIGVKGIFNSDYNYQITDFKAYKKFNLTNNAGSVDVRFSAGMVWNEVPFPLLFIPLGNQSYLYEQEGYNCMNFYEFTTDRFVAGNVNFLFNWSPVNWFNKKSKIKTSIGSRIIYGPLSDKNNPELHPELFVFNQGVTPLGNTPYAEFNVGLANIFKILRVEYAHRLTYNSQDADTGGNKLTRGSILFTGSFAF